jgi:alpha-L-rhamnosidase
MNSFNHYAYGAIGDWLYRIAAGLDTDPGKPGYQHSRIHPHPLPESGITHARAALHTLYGLLISDWVLQQDSMTMTVTVPPNTTAELILPRGKLEQVQADSQALKTGDGIQSIVQSGSDVQITLLSGTYQFRYPYHG